MEPEKPTQPPLRFVQSSAAGEDDLVRLRRIEQELAEIFYSLVARRRANTGIAGETPTRSTLDLKLELPAADALAASEALDGQLADQMLRTAERLADRTAVFPSGCVYCYWCRSFDCEHARSSDCREIFYGYSATGQPLWSDLASTLLERRDPRLDLLYRDPPATLTLVQSGDELAGDQLQIYGRGSGIYRILGQLVVGFLSARHAGTAGRQPRNEERARDHYAVTIQAVQGGDGASGVLLNVIGHLPDRTSALEALEGAADSRFADAFAKARRRLSEIALESVPRRRRSRERKRRVLDTLRGLSRNLERIFRQRTRRTQHSEERRRNKARPSSKALDDVRNAKDEMIYRDVEERTWIVVGPKNRVHVFNDRGLHVTSVVYPGETIRGRTTKGKWMRPRAKELAEFRTAVSD